MPEKILAELSQYHNLMLAISAVCCIAILYVHIKKNKISVSGIASKLHLDSKSSSKSSKPNSKSSNKKLKPNSKKRNLSWGVVNSHNMQSNPREPVYQIYSVY